MGPLAWPEQARAVLGDVSHDDGPGVAGLGQVDLHVSAGDAVVQDLEVSLLRAADGSGPPVRGLHVLLGAGGPEEGHHVGGWVRLCHQGGWLGANKSPTLALEP